MGKQLGVEWRHVTIINKTGVGGQCRVKCRYCGHSWTGGADRIRAHIVGKSGIGVAKCERAPQDVFSEMEKIQEGKEVRKKKDKEPTFNPEDARFAIQALRNESFASGGASLEASGGLSLSSVYDNNVSRKRRQEDILEGGDSIEKLFRHTLRNKADEAQRRLFYGAGIAYNVAQTKVFKDYCKAMVKAGEGYQPLSFSDLKGKHLSAEYSAVQERLKPVMETWKRYGVTICSDGWSDIRKRPIINFVASNCYGSMFLKSVDASGKKKDAQFLYDELRKVVEFVGVENVVQVVTDNGSNCVKACTMLEKDFPSIFYTRCACHCLDLLFEDIGRLDWVLPSVKGAEKIVTFIKSKESGISLWHKFCKRSLLKPVATRFAYIFIVLEQLVSEDVEKSLVKMIMSDEWSHWKHSRTLIGEEVYSLIRGADFFTHAKEIVYVLTPLLKVLRLVDREGSTMGLVYECMDHLVEVLKEMKGKVQAWKIDSIISCMMELHEGLVPRWEMLHSPLHGVGYLVNPLFREGPQHEGALFDEDLTKDWWTFLSRYTKDDIQLQTKLNEQLSDFRNTLGIGQGLHHLPVAKLRDQMLAPLQWWQNFGSSLPELRTLAMRILGQGTCSSPCERNWSSYAGIVTKKRNRLKSSNAEKLVFIHTNLHLLENLERSDGKRIEANYDKIHLEKNDERLLLVQERVDDIVESAAIIQPAVIFDMDYVEEESEDITYEEEPDCVDEDSSDEDLHDGAYDNEDVNEHDDFVHGHEESSSRVPRRTRSIRDLT